MLIQLADEDYYALGRISATSLKHILSSLRLYEHYKDTPFEGNDATHLGQVIHLLIQGEEDRVKLIDPVYKIKKDGTEGKLIDKSRTKQKEDGIYYVTKEQMTIALDLYRTAETQGLLHRLKDYKFETAYLFDICGFKAKSKLDAENASNIIDFKSTSKGVYTADFAATIDKSCYDMQAAMYIFAKADGRLDIIKDISYQIIALDTGVTYGKPREVITYDLSKSTIDRGFDKLFTALEILKNGKEKTKKI